MELTSYTAISPIDGRYADKTDPLRTCFSEYALVKARLMIMLAWLKALAANLIITEISPLTEQASNYLEQLIENFSMIDMQRIKEIESKTNHDVKAAEYFLKERLAEHPELNKLQEFIHFACTSEDVNNIAYATLFLKAKQEHLLPILDKVTQKLQALAKEYADLPLLAHTHGQPATPTTLGKELANFQVRLQRQFKQIANSQLAGKFNGAVGNYNAHLIAYPEVDWLALSQDFVKQFGLSWNEYTTQIEPHDSLAEFLQAIMRLNTILIDFSRDIWGYIALGYFTQRLVQDEIGSSTMPHKVNPIDFENAEGNLGIANALLDFLSRHLPLSRWQRDLVDSTLLRNIGVALSHSLVAYSNLIRGLAKLSANPKRIAEDLEQHWEVLAEAIQTVMRRYGVPEPYEKLKALTRGNQTVTKAELHTFIDNLALPQSVKTKLKELTPQNYLGHASLLAKKA